MQARGLRRYHEHRKALPAARNIAELRALDGPGSRARLIALRRRFRRLHEGRAGRSGLLPLTCAIVFVAVLAAGLLLDQLL